MALLLAGSMLGQSNTGKILGRVADASAAGVPGAKLTASSATLPTPLVATTNESGDYNFELVPIGIYTVTVEKTGFRTARQNNLQVKLGSQVDYNPKLEVGQLSEVIEVSASVNSLDTTSSRTATNITEAQFDALPKGRSFNSLLQMAPGVRQEAKSGNAGVGGIQVDGASGSENSFVIDGVDVSDVRRGSLRLQNALPFEFIQEVEVKSGGFEAQYGGAAGGVVNVATKPGTNDFHGRVSMFYTNDGMNPVNRGYYQRSVANANIAEFFRPKQDSYGTKYPGGIFSGRIIPNKLFFTAGTFPVLTSTTRSPQYASGAKSWKQDDLNHYFMSRVDYAPTSKLQINSSYMWTPQRQTGALPNIDPRIAAPSNDLTVQGGWQPSSAVTVSANYILTPRWLITARYGYKYQNDKLGNYGLSTAPFLVYGNSAANAGLPVPAEVNFPNGYQNVSSTFAIQRDITTRNNLYLSSAVMFGKHNLKFGYDMARLSNDVNSNYTNGRFNIFWGDAYTRGSITNAKGAYGYYAWEDGVRLNSAVNSKNHGFYVQDNWRLTRRLTLNVGVRFESEFLPPYKAEQGGVKVANPISFNWGSKVAPRLGAAYDVLGDGKWKISGSFGYYYDVMKYELARGSFGGDFWVTHIYTLDNPNVLNLGLANPGAAGKQVIQFDNRTIPINSRGELEGIDPNIKPFKQRRFSAALEHQLTARSILGVRYTRTDVLAGIEDIGVLDGDDEVYLIGNPGLGDTRNTKSVYGAKTPNGKEFLVPKATRQYDAVEFRLQGQKNRVTYLASYTVSRLWGNWSGLANSDESGRSDPGVSRAFDLPYYYFDQSGSQKNVFGRLATDRPHEIKGFLSYDLKSKIGTTLFGLTQVAWSGVPDSTSVIYQSAPTFPHGRGDMGRTPFYTQTDFNLAHTVKFTERYGARFEVNFINLLNQAAVVSRTTQINRTGAISAAQLPLSQFFGGYDVNKFVYPGNYLAGKTPQYNPIYGLPGGNYRAGGPGAYQSPRNIRLGISFLF
ncbi:MAG: TonB-dependent receptor [Candidatus Solibacter usitatus]|nr:TonB-dependent receptor [Candidatus Solibacter usitatus]